MTNRRKLQRPTQPARASDAVTVAYVHDTEVGHNWYRSMTDLLMFDIGTEARVIRGGYIAVRYSTGGIVAARNQAAAMFLEARDAEWLFWVDTDAKIITLPAIAAGLDGCGCRIGGVRPSLGTLV